MPSRVATTWEVPHGHHAVLIVIGDKLGLYKAMVGAGPLSSGELARTTGTAERYAREWLNANAARGFVTYDAVTDRYELPAEQAFAPTTLDLPGAFHIVSACFKDEPKITQAFRTGEWVGWRARRKSVFRHRTLRPPTFRIQFDFVVDSRTRKAWKSA